MPDFNQYAPAVPFAPHIFSKVNVADSFVAVPGFPKLDDLPEVTPMSMGGSVEGTLGSNPFSKWSSLITGNPAASTDYWSNRKFTDDVNETDAYHDVGFLIGRDNEDLFGKHGKGLLTSTWDTMLTLVDKIGTSTLSTLGTIGGLIGIGNKSDQYNTGSAFKDWIAGASDNGLVKLADNWNDDIDNLKRPTYQEAVDREKGFFHRMATDGDFWTTDVIDGASFMLGGMGVAKALKFFAPGARLLRGIKGLQGLKYADELSALSADGLTGASEGASISANTVIGETGGALAEGTFKGGVAAAGGEATNASMPFYNKMFKTILRTTDPKEIIDKGIITFVNTAGEAMMEANGFKNDMIDQMAFAKNSDGTSKYNPDQIKNAVAKNMTDVFSANMIALTLSNVWETNLFYGKGKMFSGRNLGNSLLNVPKDVLGTAEIVSRTFGEKGADYLKKLGEGILAEGIWEENIQLAIQRVNTDTINGDEGFFEKLGAYVGKAISQTGAAFTGNDPEAAMNIGVGGLMGGFMGAHERFKEIRELEHTVKNYNDNTNFIKATSESFFKKNDDGTPVIEKGKPVLDKSKIVGYMSSMNKVLNTTELYHALKDTNAKDLYNIVQNDLFSRMVKGYADAGIVDTLIKNLDSQSKFSAEDLSFLGFDPISDHQELQDKINSFKEKADRYKNIYDNIERNFIVKIKKDKNGQKERAMKDTMYHLSTRADYLSGLKNDYDNQKEISISESLGEGNSHFNSPSDSIIDSLNDLLARSRAAKNRLDILSNNNDDTQLPGTTGLRRNAEASLYHISEGVALIVPNKGTSKALVTSKGETHNINNQRGSYVEEEDLAKAHQDFEDMRKEVDDFMTENKESLEGMQTDANGFYRYENNGKNSQPSSLNLNKQRSISAELERAINATYNVFSRLSDIRSGEKYYDEVYGKRKSDMFKYFEKGKQEAVGNQKLLEYYESQKDDSEDDLNDPSDGEVNGGVDPVKEAERNAAREPGTEAPPKKKGGKAKTPGQKAADLNEVKSDLRAAKEKKEALEGQEDVSLEDEAQIEELNTKIDELENKLDDSISDLSQEVVDNSENIPAEKKDLFKDVLNKIAKFARTVVKTDDGYLIDGQPYKRVSDVINNTIPESVRPLLAGSIDAGMTVDAVVKAFFSTGVTEDFKNSFSNKISGEALDKIVASLTKVKESLAKKGIDIIASNVIVHDPVAKVAGEIDLLGVDNNGNFKIYEIEARRGRIWYKVLNREGVGQKIADLTQNQLSAYRNLFANQYGVVPNEIGVMFPVAVDIDDNPGGAFISKAKVLDGINVVPKSILKINSFINKTLGRSAFKGYNIWGIYANTFFGKTQSSEKGKFGFIARNVSPVEIVGKVTMKVREAQQSFKDAFKVEQEGLLNGTATLTRHPDAPNLYALKGDKEIAVYYEGQLAGLMSPVPSLAYKKDDGTFAVLDENVDVDTYVATTGNSAKSYPDFVNTTLAYKAAHRELIDGLNNSDGEHELSNEEVQKLFDVSVNYGSLDLAKADERPLLKDLSMRGVKIGNNQVITVVNLDDNDAVQILMDKNAKTKRTNSKYLEMDKWANANLAQIKAALETKTGNKRSSYAAIVELPDGSFQPIALKLVPGTTIAPDADYVADLGTKFTAAVKENVFSNPSIALGAKGVNVTTNLSLSGALYSAVFDEGDVESLEKLGIDPEYAVGDSNLNIINNFLSGLSEEDRLTLESFELSTADDIMDAYLNTEGFSNIDDFIKDIKECKL